MAEILDPANFKGSNGSCQKDDNRKPTVAAVAATGRLLSSSSAAAYIIGSILKISVSCEQYEAYNCFLNDGHFERHFGFLGKLQGDSPTFSMLFDPYFQSYPEIFSLL